MDSGPSCVATKFQSSLSRSLALSLSSSISSCLNFQSRRSFICKMRRLSFSYSAALLLQNNSSLLIQKRVRIYFAKKKANTARILNNRRKLQERYFLEANVVAFYYEQHGAAFKIQRWFLGLKWYKLLLNDRRVLKWRERHVVNLDPDQSLSEVDVIEEEIPKEYSIYSRPGSAISAAMNIENLTFLAKKMTETLDFKSHSTKFRQGLDSSGLSLSAIFRGTAFSINDRS